MQKQKLISNISRFHCILNFKHTSESILQLIGQHLSTLSPIEFAQSYELQMIRQIEKQRSRMKEGYRLQANGSAGVFLVYVWKSNPQKWWFGYCCKLQCSQNMKPTFEAKSTKIFRPAFNLALDPIAQARVSIGSDWRIYQLNENNPDFKLSYHWINITINSIRHVHQLYTMLQCKNNTLIWFRFHFCFENIFQKHEARDIRKELIIAIL